MQLGLQSLRLLVMALSTALGACAGSPPVPVKPFELKPRELDVKFRHGSPPAALLFRPRYSTPGEAGVILEPPAASPPRPPTGTTVSGLAAQCDPLHYLLDRANAEDATGIDNRFSWWTKTAPDSGPLRPPALADPIATRNSLICHFHPALARV